jgi:HEAT repeat protein
MEPLSIASIAGKLLITEAAKAGLAGLKNHFQPDELTRVLKKAIELTEAVQSPTGGLFSRCDVGGPQGTQKFLDAFFSEGEVLRTLQKPFQDQGKPDVAILLTAFEKLASEHPEAKNYLPALLRPWMETFVESYFEQIKGICFQVAKSQYLQQLARRVDDVKFVGIAVPGEEVEKQEVLAQIFVMPDVREERSQNLSQVSVTINGQSAYHVSLASEESPEIRELNRLIKQNDLLKEQKEWATRDRSSPRISAPEILNPSQKKAVVLGAPGSGKTMLVSYFALMLCETQQSDPTQISLEKDANYLPIVVRIRDWILQPNMDLLEYLRWDAKKNSYTKELPVGFFEHWLEQGRALILLDGLDEVVDEVQRIKVAKQIDMFLYRYQDNPAVITSRPAGYKGHFKSNEFPHYTLESFDDKQVATFIDHWYDSRLKGDAAQATRRKADLQKAFARNERIRLLAKNPLLLTIITLIHRYQAELPRQRCKLYEKAVETLLTSWDSGKEIKLYSQVLLFLKSDDLLYILKKLAYWIHTQGSTGETEGGTLIDKDELIRWLRKEIQTLKKCEAHEAKGEAERFIDFIQRRTGLLNEQGRDRYAFVHKTFQEYLTAEEIFDRADVDDDTDIILSHFREHLHDQHWREVLLLLVSKLKGKKAQKAIQTVLDANSEYEHWLHRSLLFAGWCLTEDPPELTLVAGDLVGEILDRLVGLEVENVDRVGSKIREEARKILHCFGETSVERVVWEKLKAQGDRIDRFRLIEFQAALGKEVEVVNALLSLLSDSDSYVRFTAASRLDQLGNSSLEVVNALLSLLSDSDSNVRLTAVLALGQLGNSSLEVVNALLSLLSDSDSNMRLTAASALVQLGNSSPELVNSLRFLQSDSDSNVRDGATLVLLELENSNPKVVNALRRVIRHSDMRHYGTEFIENSSPEVVNALLSSLRDSDSYVRLRTASRLASMAKTSDTIRPKVVQWLEKNPNYDEIGSAIDCLWSIMVE